MDFQVCSDEKWTLVSSQRIVGNSLAIFMGPDKTIFKKFAVYKKKTEK